MASNVLVLNGPNLNLLGQREPEIYGRETLDDIRALLEAEARALKLGLDFRQTNSEAELIDWIQGARQGVAGLILNAGGYTHTSIAVLDALRSLEAPIIEVHLSNVYRRESFRHVSFVSQAATGVIAGLGSHGYVLALQALARLINRT
ncbi:MAG: type II 3-dehydroquinate dehydratase [Alphaproteobacteria bacterium]|nr:type II 3-dehydroquinate dehydratase [Alphaproteobacteria bacterium]